MEIHLVDSESGRRTDAGRMFAALGCHTEAYADLGELLRHPPREGIIIAHQAAPAEWAGTIRYALDDARIPLPLILASETVDTRRVVGAMAAGAFDYLALPLEKPEVAAVLERALELAGEATRERRRMIEARMRMSALSAREREVLELLITGASNKVVARMLAISPRTVEIHRANMMVKLRVNHVAGAVRLHFEARAAGRRS